MADTKTEPTQAEADARIKASGGGIQSGRPGDTQTDRVNVQATQDRMAAQEEANNHWIWNAEQGTQITDLLKPGCWAHMAPRLRPYDRIEVRVDDSLWLADLLVLESGRNWARVKVLQKWELDTRDVAETVAEEHKIEFKGAHLKYCVIRRRDDALMSKHHATKTSAEDWLRSYQRSLGT